MKIKRLIITGIVLLVISVSGYTQQDVRTTETRVADLLARMPANDLQFTDQLMGDMLSLGESGIRQICDKIIPPGSVDDTGPRFAVESLSRFLSQDGKESERGMWEKICISYAVGLKDASVKDFFMKQLQLVGGDLSVEALKEYLNSKDLCEPAVAVLGAVGGAEAEVILAESLKNSDLPCAAAVMNTLAKMNSEIAVSEYIEWSSDNDTNVRASALNALAKSGSPAAYKVLSKAAKKVSYEWEPSGITQSLINYAEAIGQKGDIKTMDKICRLVMIRCNDDLTLNSKTAALETYVSFHGRDAMPYLLKGAAHLNKKYRAAALRISLSIPGSEVTNSWINYFPKAIAEARPEIITMLGERGDKIAIPLVTASLSDLDINTRIEAAEAIVKLSGPQSVNSLINYLLVFTGDQDQDAAKKALMTVTGNDQIPLLLPVLKDGPPPAQKSVIELLAWNSDNKYFTEVCKYASTAGEPVKSSAIKALASLAGPDDQAELIELLADTDDPGEISDLQTALAAAAGKIADPELRSDLLIKSIQQGRGLSSTERFKEKLIQVIAKTGGREALALVLKEFENGSPGMRDVCFKALTGWADYAASYALYEICASGNKTFEGPAFDGYVRQIRSAVLPDEQKLLLYRKIMPYALTPERKNRILTETGRLKTYQALFYAGTFLDDPATSASAARAAMNIALPSSDESSGMYGDLVKDILTRAAAEITGQESEYEKERIRKYLADMPVDKGFQPMFNGKDLTGWQGLVENPVVRPGMTTAELAAKQIEANRKVAGNWSVKDGCIWFTGSGDNLCSVKEYGDFELLVDWKISKAGDSGIYLRGTPQVQIWDTSRVEVGAQVGSGGLYNNQKNPSKPLKVADNPVGDWNTFRIIMIGEKVSVWLNGELVVDNVTLENYWDRKIPIFPKGPIELQAHGTDLAFRDIYVREISEREYKLTPEEKADGFVALFNGRNLDNWIGNKESYVVENEMIVVKPDDSSGGNLYTEKEYSDFIFRFEFLLTPGANNGLGIRAPLTGDAAYVGMELQILDNTAPVYANLQPYQYHGSVYGVIPAKRGYLKPVGEWNYEEVTVTGTRIKIVLNGTVIVDGDIAGPRDNGTMDHNDHPGLKNTTGHIGFLGHGSELKFRNIRIKDLSQ